MSKIFFHTAGRLGNQLFQFAFGHQLSMHFDKKVVFFLDKFHHRYNYRWNVATEMKDCSHIEKLTVSNARGFILKVSDNLFYRHKKCFERLNSDARIMRAMNAFDFPEMPDKSPVLVTGFYLSAASIEKSPVFLDELESHLMRRVDTSRFDLQHDYEIIHVRGTDMNNSVYGSLGKNYYTRFSESKVPRYVITDDVIQAKTVTQGLNVAKIFSPEEVNPWEAISLMRNSKKVFVSNSTLAWWGGYLCLKNGGEAILPKPFYKENAISTQSLHIEGFKYLDSAYD